LIARLLGAFAFALVGIFLASAAARGLMDVLMGEAVEESGATALPSRRSGLSMKLPNGRHLEFILWNPWAPLQAGLRYRVTYGRFSRVLVRPPVAER
jgi:hypothetical protein